MTKVSIESRASEVFVESWVEFVISNNCHYPDDSEDESPSTCGVQALKGIVIIQWVEEKLTKAAVVHWAANCV
jgi:hypothetical protein